MPTGLTGYRIERAVDITMPVAAPRQPSCRQTGAATVDLAWEPVAGATGYEVRCWEGDPATPDAWVVLNTAGSTTVVNGSQGHSSITLTVTDTLAQLAGLPDSYSLWQFQVRATGAGGASAWSSSTYRSRGTGAYRLAVPTGLSLQSSGTVTLEWETVTGPRATSS